MPESRRIPSVFDDLEVGITLHDPETGDMLGANERLEELCGKVLELISTWAGYALERQRRERQYRSLTERISDAYYAFDTDWNVTYWNDVVAERTGRPPPELAARQELGRRPARGGPGLRRDDHGVYHRQDRGEGQRPDVTRHGGDRDEGRGTRRRGTAGKSEAVAAAADAFEDATAGRPSGSGG